MTRFFCIMRDSQERINYQNYVQAENAIEALRKAATKARLGGIWTAYIEVATKNVEIGRSETVNVLFTDVKS